MSDVVVQTLVIEPVRNSVSGVISTPLFMFATPTASVSIRPSSRTPTTAPGMPCRATRSSALQPQLTETPVCDPARGMTFQQN
jgi:hypothetical protein